MDQMTGTGVVTGQSPSPLARSLRWAMIVYLSPLILLVTAVGLVGVVATRLASSPPGSIRLVHRPHFGKARTLASVPISKKIHKTYEA